MGRCSCKGCNRAAKCKGYCEMHYARVKRWGSPDILKKMPNGTNASEHPLYSTWRGLADRCLTPTNEAYPLYGGRGIKICERWRPPYGFWNFVEDMGNKPSEKHSLDRIDVNGDYCPENCRWATQSEQMNNTRVNRRFVAFGEEGTFTELFRKFAPEGLKKKTAERRFYEMSWTLEKAITALPYGRS